MVLGTFSKSLVLLLGPLGGLLGDLWRLLGVSSATFGGFVGRRWSAVGRRWFLPTATGLRWACCLPCVSKSGLETHGFFGSCLLPSRLLLFFELLEVDFKCQR